MLLLALAFGIIFWIMLYPNIREGYSGTGVALTAILTITCGFPILMGVLYIIKGLKGRKELVKEIFNRIFNEILKDIFKKVFKKNLKKTCWGAAGVVLIIVINFTVLTRVETINVYDNVSVSGRELAGRNVEHITVDDNIRLRFTGEQSRHFFSIMSWQVYYPVVTYRYHVFTPNRRRVVSIKKSISLDRL